MNKKLYRLIIDGEVDKFYASREWRSKRKEIINRDNNECQKCKEEGRVGNAECVHHKLHLTARPDLALADSNLITLCNTCHNIEHPEKLREYRPNNKFINEERWE